MDINAKYHWERQREAEALILEILASATEANPAILKLSEELFNQTSTRLFDWIDFVSVTDSSALEVKIKSTGFVLQEQAEGAHRLFVHPGAQLPRIFLHSHSQDEQVGIAVAVDSIADFLMVRGEHRIIEGSLFGQFRRCRYSIENGAALWLIERRGSESLLPSTEDPERINQYLQALEKWMSRPRPLIGEDRALEKTITLATQLVAEVGQSRAAWTVLEGERRYWQARNTAGQIQKNRQDRLGMGWANHDHHTFRSSRSRFSHLVHLFEILGFYCRERFYAGEEAGWGAQVMENAACRLVLFLDVDLAPHEVTGDFAHTPLPHLDKLGTIGLWCALHGDSILRGGMHHLEAQFMFNELTYDLGQHGIKMMPPFSSFPYLKQAFTVGETWQVEPDRVHILVGEGKITSKEGENFLTDGAIGSHLENLQRREGYKGFNQKNVSAIIRETDPRIQGC